jgi:hypothetical protein
VVNRTGISDHFFGYKSGGPDQFFYTQNLIFYFLLMLLVQDILSRFQRKIALVIYLPLVFSYIIGNINVILNPSRNDFMARDVGNIFVNASQACQEIKSNEIALNMYPALAVPKMKVDRKQICTPRLEDYQEERVSLGLSLNGNFYIVKPDTPVFQVFTSPQDKLNAVWLYMSTFMEPINDSYTFSLYDKSCTQEIRRVVLPRKLTDNAYEEIEFPALLDSQGETYCFVLKSNHEVVKHPVAVQLSHPEQYTTGYSLLEGVRDSRSLIFELGYARFKNER